MSLPKRRAAVMAAVLDAGGSWTPRQLSAYARAHGGSDPTYEALHSLVAKGKLAYTPNRWSVPAPTFDHAATQRRGKVQA